MIPILASYLPVAYAFWYNVMSIVLGPVTLLAFFISVGVLSKLAWLRWDKFWNFRKFFSWHSYTSEENFQMLVWFIIAVAAYAIDLIRRAYLQVLQASKMVTDGLKLVRMILTIITVPSMGWSKGSAFTRSVCDSVKAMVDGSDVILQELQGKGDEKETSTEEEKPKTLPKTTPQEEVQIMAAAAVQKADPADQHGLSVSGFKWGGHLDDHPLGGNKDLLWSSQIRRNVMPITATTGETMIAMKGLALTDNVMDEESTLLAIAGWHEFFLKCNNQLYDNMTLCAFPKVPRIGYGVKHVYSLGVLKKWFALLGVWWATKPRPFERPALAELDVTEVVAEFEPVARTWYQRLSQQYRDLCVLLEAKDRTKQLVVVLALVTTTMVLYCSYVYTFKSKAKKVIEANEKTVKEAEVLAKKEKENLEMEQKLSREMREKQRGAEPNNERNRLAVDQNYDNFVGGVVTASASKPEPVQKDQNLANIAYNEKVKEKLTKKKEKRAEKQEMDRVLQFIRKRRELIDAGVNDSSEFRKLMNELGFKDRTEVKAALKKYGLELESKVEGAGQKPKINFHKVFAARVGMKNFVCRSCFNGDTEHPNGQERPDWHKKERPNAKWVQRPCLSHEKIVQLMQQHAEELKHCDEFHTILAVHKNWKGNVQKVDAVIPSPLEALNPNVHNVHMQTAARSGFYIQMDGHDDEMKVVHGGSNGVCAKGLYIIPLHFYQVNSSRPIKTEMITVYHFDDTKKSVVQTVVKDEKLVQEFDRIYQAHCTNDQLAIADLMVINNAWWAKAGLPQLHSTSIITNQPVVKQATVSPVFVEKDGKVEIEMKSICTTRTKEDAICLDGTKFSALCYIASTKNGDCGFGVYLHNCLAATHRRGNESPGEQSGRLFTPNLVELLTHANDLSWLFQVGGSSRRV